MKNNNGLVVTIIILVIALIGVCGYLVYDKFVLESNDVKNDYGQEEDYDNDEVIVLGQILNTGVGRFIVEKDGTVYYEDSSNLKLLVNSYKNTLLDTEVLGKKNEYVSNTHKAMDGSAYRFSGYKLDLSNIRTAYEIYFGNGEEARSIMFLSRNGEVSLMNFEYKEMDQKNGVFVKLEKQLNDYKNIVSIVSFNGNSGSYALLIDKDGNQYSYVY